MNVRLPARRSQTGFTLVELLVVLVIIALLASLAIVGFTATNDSQNFASEVSDLQQIFSDARAYAMGNNTYVFVGLEEVDSAVSATGSQTPYTVASGKGGRIGVAVAASIDGTNLETVATSTFTSGDITGTLVPISKLRSFSGIHIQPNYYNVVPTSTTSGLRNRVSVTNKFLIIGYNTLINGKTPFETFNWPMTGPVQYTFNNIVRFGPDGSAALLSNTVVGTKTPAWMELDLQQMHGDVTTSLTTYTSATISTAKHGQEVAIIQIDGITGNSQVYQQ